MLSLAILQPGLRPQVRLGLISTSALLICSSLHGQVALNLASGSVPIGNAYNQKLTFGPTQSAGAPITTAGAANGSGGLAFYTAPYVSFGKSNPFNIVGTDPSLGPATTTIPNVIVPLRIVFSAFVGSPTLDASEVTFTTANSPIFQSTDYTVGGTDLGFTQFGDAVQRAQFWNLPGFSTDYHVLLGNPVIARTVTVNVPANSGSVFRLGNGGLLGILEATYFNSVLTGLLPSYAANQVPIFLTNNVFVSSTGGLTGCCTLGFHSSQGPPIATAKTWIFAAYAQPGTFFNDQILDVQSLSHEVTEWLNDPFVGTPFKGGVNLVPPAVLPGQGQCIINFETGDPLEAPPAVFTKVINGTTYHLQDEVFLWWYLHTSPSPAVNGWYTLINTFAGPSTLCGAG